MRQHQMAMPLALLGLALVLVGLAIAGPAEAAGGCGPSSRHRMCSSPTIWPSAAGGGFGQRRTGGADHSRAAVAVAREPFNGMALVSAG